MDETKTEIEKANEKVKMSKTEIEENKKNYDDKVELLKQIYINRSLKQDNVKKYIETNFTNIYNNKEINIQNLDVDKNIFTTIKKNLEENMATTPLPRGWIFVPNSIDNNNLSGEFTDGFVIQSSYPITNKSLLEIQNEKDFQNTGTKIIDELYQKPDKKKISEDEFKDIIKNLNTPVNKGSDGFYINPNNLPSDLKKYNSNIDIDLNRLQQLKSQYVLTDPLTTSLDSIINKLKQQQIKNQYAIQKLAIPSQNKGQLLPPPPPPPIPNGSSADWFGAATMGGITLAQIAAIIALPLLGGKTSRKNKKIQKKSSKRIRKKNKTMKGGKEQGKRTDSSYRKARISNATRVKDGLGLLKSRSRLRTNSNQLKKVVTDLKGMLNKTTQNALMGGKVLDSGGFGCVFKPALKCKNHNQRAIDSISKLMPSSDTDEEFYEISKYEPILKKIPNYRNYFIIDGITICDPDKLTKEDLDNFSKCTAFKKYDITPKNINENLQYFAMLNEPDGGPELDEFVKEIFTNYSKLISVNNSLIGLLQYGIIPMNKLKIFHFDIKGSNILVSAGGAMNTRLIDWGLSHQLINNKDIMLDEISHRPFQFNLPYSIIIFNKKFGESYEQFLLVKRNATAAEIYTYIFNYLVELEKTDKGAHLRGVLRDFKMIFNGQFAMNTIAKYIADILVKYTKNNKLELHDYLSIFLNNVDIWGFATAYLAFTDVISKKTHLDQMDKQIVECIRKVFTLLFQYNLSPINVPNLTVILRTMNFAFKPDSPNERKMVNLYVSKKNVQNSKSRLSNHLK
jgi:hypothetical protein